MSGLDEQLSDDHRNKGSTRGSYRHQAGPEMAVAAVLVVVVVCTLAVGRAGC